MKSLIPTDNAKRSVGDVGPKLTGIKQKNVLKAVGGANLIRGQPQASTKLGTPSTASVVGRSGSMPKQVLKQRSVITPSIKLGI